jgi:hypothetical protein
MGSRAHEELDLLARQVLSDCWEMGERPGRVDIGVNRHTWLVAQRRPGGSYSSMPTCINVPACQERSLSRTRWSAEKGCLCTLAGMSGG